MNQEFERLCQRWREWAKSADKSENGWQSDFPEWDKLMAVAQSIMSRVQLDPDDLSNLELCWSISEENEEMAGYAAEHIDECWSTIARLIRSSNPAVRWQVYSVLGSAGRRSEPLLLKALEDQDSYCRRRAILSLAQIRPSNAKEIAARFGDDEDPYIRQAAQELIRNEPA